jgi:hypothetical protein
LLGLVAVEVVLSPKLQLRLTMVPSVSLEASVNVQLRTLQLDVNAAVGAALDDGAGASSPWQAGTDKESVKVPAVATNLAVYRLSRSLSRSTP